MKFKRIVASFLLGAMVMTGCSSKPADKPAEKKPVSQTETKKKIKYVMISDDGGINDGSFNETAHDGLKELEKEGIAEISVLESKQESDYKTNFDLAIDANNDLIAGIGFKLAPDLAASAKANPDKKYIIIDNAFEGIEGGIPKNVVATRFADHENSFLNGYLAGTLTTSNKIGYIGGMDFPLIRKFEAGFRAGVELAAKDNNKKIEIISQYVNSFNDVAKGKATANSMYLQGADMIFHVAGKVGEGVIESAKENQKFTFGIDKDQSHMAPEYVIASNIKKVNVAIKTVGKELAEGKFRGGELIEFSLKTDGVDIKYGKEDQLKVKLSKELKDKINELKKQIIEGKIVVPTVVKDADK